MYRSFLLSVLLIFSILFQSFKTKEVPLYKDPKAKIADRVQDLLKRMTLEEKVGQLTTLLGWDMYTKNGRQITASQKFKDSVRQQHIGMLWATLRADPWTKKTLQTGLSPIEAAQATNALQKFMVDSTRLGIPLLLSEECPHGHMAIGTTVFPTAIGQASTWDPSLIKQMAGVIAEEARSLGAHIGYGPILDLAREPRWSRLEETYGEDPVLNGQMGEAVVSGFQGNDLKSGKNIISTLKHFVAYGVPDGGHNGGSVAIGQRELQQYYLPPFEQAVKAGALSVMTAYNSIDGVACSANPWLLQDILRKEWGFKGFVVSDLGSISGLASNHAVAGSAAEAAAQATNAGLDADLGGYGYGPSLLQAIKEHRVSEGVLDTAVSHVLTQKFNMGLFEQPYVTVGAVQQHVHTSNHVDLARKVAQESIILLKNDQHLLPLSKQLKSIAVIGPNADNVYNQLGDYTAPQADGKVITVLKGIQDKIGKSAKINYVKGCSIRDTSMVQLDEAVAVSKQSEVVVVVLGGSSARDFKTSYQETGAADVSTAAQGVSDMESGEGYDRATLDLMGKQLDLLKALQKTGKPLVLVTIKGRPLNLNWAEAYIPAIVDAWYPGQEGGHAVADVLFGDYNPAGRLTVSVPKAVGQLPIYYNAKKPGPHNYVEMDAKPLYPFGYGLSYSTFSYSNLQQAYHERENDFSLDIIFKIKNNSPYDGDEVPQLYVRDEVSSIVTPVMQLKAFQRIHVKAGEEKEVHFTLNANDLKLLNPAMQWITEKGVFKLMIGTSSTDIRLKDDFKLEKDFKI